jgi:hypothetical protein
MASSTLPPPLALFHLFPKLIPELRIYIWHIALEIPRLVVIWSKYLFIFDYANSKEPET